MRSISARRRMYSNLDRKSLVSRISRNSVSKTNSLFKSWTIKISLIKTPS